MPKLPRMIAQEADKDLLLPYLPFNESKVLIEFLEKQGVKFLNSRTNTLIDINPDKILPGSIIYPNVTLEGKRTFIAKGAQIGIRGPVYLKNSVAGPNVVLGQGSAEEAVFLRGSRAGTGFSCRRGTIYEEGVITAEQTDTKMTILFPWVTYGSNINGCDLLAAGGVGPELSEFTEFGSGFIHFNFTIRGDKATPSLFGNVPEGVFLRSPRIFIGGNTSVIGPITAQFGSYAAAGIRISENLKADKIYLGKRLPGGFMDYDPAVYPNAHTIYRRNINFIANLIALEHWYRFFRIPLFEDHTYREARKNIQHNIQERIEQLERVVRHLPESISRSHPPNRQTRFKEKLISRWDRIKEQLDRLQTESETSRKNKDNFLNSFPAPETTYLEFIKSLPETSVRKGVLWLAGIVLEVNQQLEI